MYLNSFCRLLDVVFFKRKKMFQVDLAKEEKCEFVPFMSPQEVIVKDGKVFFFCLNCFPHSL